MRKGVVFLFLLFFGSGIYFVHPFGQNKVRYHKFDWKVLSTKHFDIFYYFSEKQIKEVAKVAEEVYQEVTTSLKYIPSKITPLIVYLCHNEFEETNVTPSFIGEGVGGITTLLKDRIALPLSFSRHQFKRVLTHEFTHVLTLDYLSKGHLAKAPLWFIEGLAEYEAGHWDIYEKMLLREAVLAENLIPLTSLSEALAGAGNVYLAYKEAHSVFDYLSLTFGHHKIIDLFRAIKEAPSFDEALTKTIGLTTEELDVVWQIYLKRKYEFFERENKLLLPGFTLKKIRDNALFPQFSPDGEKIIFFSSERGETELFLTDKKFKKITSLSKRFLGRGFEHICQTGTIFSWHPEGEEIIFVAQRKGENCFFIQNISTKKIIRRIEISALDDVFSPRWSDDGKKIVFCGFKDGQTDIYSIHRDGTNLIRWTDDIFTEGTPAFLPQDKGIVYSVEWAGERILLTLSSPGGDPIPLSIEGNNLQPVVASDQKKIFFISSRKNEVYNLYQITLEEEKVKQITAVRSGVFNPSVFGEEILCNIYEKGRMNAYLICPGEEEKITQPTLVFLPPWGEEYQGKTYLPTGEEKELLAQRRRAVKKEEREFIGRESAIKSKKGNKFGLSIDRVFPFIFYDPFRGYYLGFGLIASDILGDHYLVAQGENIQLNSQAGSVEKQIRDTNFAIDYYSFKHRLAYEMGYFNWNTYYYKPGWRYLLKRYLSGAYLSGSYPFDRFRRVEAGVFCQVDDWKEERIYIMRGIGVSFITDTVKMNFLHPREGQRSKYLAVFVDDILKGNTEFNSFQLDFRQYFTFFRRFTLAGRVKAGHNVGKDRYDFYLGGANTLRGFQFRECEGTNFLLTNWEMRIRFFKNFLSVNDFYGVLFTDVGEAFDNIEKIPWGEFKVSLGVGIRFTLLPLPVIWRLDWAWPISRGGRETFYLYWDNMF
jgi:hypothetical protein